MKGSFNIVPSSSFCRMYRKPLASPHDSPARPVARSRYVLCFELPGGIGAHGIIPKQRAGRPSPSPSLGFWHVLDHAGYPFQFVIPYDQAVVFLASTLSVRLDKNKATNTGMVWWLKLPSCCEVFFDRVLTIQRCTLGPVDLLIGPKLDVGSDYENVAPR